MCQMTQLVAESIRRDKTPPKLSIFVEDEE